MLAQGRLDNSIATNFSLSRKAVETIFLISSLGLTGALVGLSLLQLAPKILVNPTAPKNFTITSLTDVSFTISWNTSAKTTGWVVYGKSPDTLEKKAFDNLAREDLAGFNNQRHTITLTNLDPNSYYYFEIVSGNANFSTAEGRILKPVLTPSQSVLTNPLLERPGP